MRGCTCKCVNSSLCRYCKMELTNWPESAEKRVLVNNVVLNLTTTCNENRYLCAQFVSDGF